MKLKRTLLFLLLGFILTACGSEETNIVSVGQLSCEFGARDFGKIQKDGFNAKYGFCPFYDIEEALDVSRQWNRPVLAYFHSYEDENSRKLEKDLWGNPQIKDYIFQNFLVLSLPLDDERELFMSEYIDGSEKKTLGEKNSAYQNKLYQTNDIPFQAVINYNFQNLEETWSFNLETGPYLDWLKNAKEIYEELHPRAGRDYYSFSR